MNLVLVVSRYYYMGYLFKSGMTMCNRFIIFLISDSLIFDNRYSWVTAKTVHYKVQVENRQEIES